MQKHFTVGDFGMKMTLGKQDKNHKLPVFLLLRLNDKYKSHVEGCFLAEVELP